MQIIIITGIGDHTGYIRFMTKKWQKKYGLPINVYAYGWHGESSDYQNRQAQLYQHIDQLAQKSQGLCLIGISAGASAALNSLIDKPSKIVRVITICGRAKRGGKSIMTFKSFPLYWKSIDTLQNRIDQLPVEKVLAIFPLLDLVVPIKTMLIPRAQKQLVRFVGHIPSVLWILATKGELVRSYLSRI